jgi:hypothetical protein
LLNYHIPIVSELGRSGIWGILLGVNCVTDRVTRASCYPSPSLSSPLFLASFFLLASAFVMHVLSLAPISRLWLGCHPPPPTRASLLSLASSMFSCSSLTTVGPHCCPHPCCRAPPSGHPSPQFEILTC